MKVLLADADVDTLDVTTYALRREGFAVVAATTGAQALDRWRADSPDVVVADLRLPRQGAFEACRLIRRDSDTPMVLLAAAGDEPAIVRCLELGADGVIFTPVSPALLVAGLRALLRRCRHNPYVHAMGEVRAGDCRT